MSANNLMNDLCDVFNKYVNEVSLAEFIGIMEILKSDLINSNFKEVIKEMQSETRENI